MSPWPGKRREWAKPFQPCPMGQSLPFHGHSALKVWMDASTPRIQLTPPQSLASEYLRLWGPCWS